MTYLINLDEATSKALDRIAPVAERKRAEFIRQAVKEAIRRYEYALMREAYRVKPDAPSAADDWSDAEQFKP